MTNVKPKLFMLDNLDSFTYNLVDEFQQMGFEPVIYRNTLPADFIVEQIEACEQPVMLVLSPGPGTPSNAGCLMALIEKTIGRYPILGICLGHQALVQHYGGVVDRAPEIVHGKSSLINHTETGPFANISNPFPVARYHSLVATQLPDTIEVTADHNNMVMAVENTQDRVLGYQFHPESILTTYGTTLLQQSIDYLFSLPALSNGDLNND